MQKKFIGGEIPLELHQHFRVRAAMLGVSMVRLLTAAIEHEIARPIERREGSIPESAP